MRRKKRPTSLFRRLTSPVREFLQADVDMTERALHRAPPSTRRLFCAPSLFLIWLLEELELAAADLKTLLTPRRPSSRPTPPADSTE